MTDVVADTRIVAASPEQIWAILEDPAALARVLPGAESFVADGPGRFRAVLASRVHFITIRADVVATYHDARPPHHLRLTLEGRPRGLSGEFQASIPFDLTPLEDDRTRISYEVAMEVTGRLATFGTGVMRDTLRTQIGELVRNVEREAQRRG